MEPGADAVRQWGGRRSGSGRKKRNQAALPEIDIAHALSEPAPDEIEGVAQRHAATAIEALVKQLKSGVNETARIGAANAVLDRGYGKPAIDIGGFQTLPLFGGVSLKPIGSEIRTEARKYARLAIETLRKIADNGRSEGARVAAAKSLLDRGLGTVAPAKIDLDAPTRPIGKREQASLDAQTAAAGGADDDWGDDLRPRVH